MTATLRPKLLVVDDDGDIQRAIKRAAEASGYEVLQEFDGRLAVAVARESQPDLILLDISMPGADGRDVLQRLKADAETRKIPVVIHSSRTDQTDRHVGLELGADDYVDKPCAASLLMLKLGRLIEKAREATTSS